MAGRACQLCGRRSRPVSAALGVCGPCVRERSHEALALTRTAHQRSRLPFGLPAEPPRTKGGITCPLCSRACRIGDRQYGYCGLRTARDRRLVHLSGTRRAGTLHWYRDPLPTNCVADWVCDGHRQSGRHNLAVFYSSCSFDCLFCQNWSFRTSRPRPSEATSASDLAGAANRDTYCVCFFGGDPATQMPHALAAARRMGGQGVVVCWETAGSSNPKLLDEAVRLSRETGGCIKFDLKAHSEALHVALTGASNRRTLENFARAAARSRERPAPPLVVASTLLVPGYVDSDEVERIARFIAGIDPRIPYSLLAFAPSFLMTDLPRTSRHEAGAAEAAARGAGLSNVHVGNRHLLGDHA